MIHIDEILQPQRIFLDLKPAPKAEVLRQMTQRLDQQGAIEDSAHILQALLDREELMTTGVKRGFAFPHAFSPQFDQSLLALGVCREGIDYHSLDREPVEYVFMLLGPPHNQTLHLRVLARVSRLTGQPDMLDALREAQTAEELMDILTQTERRLTAYPFSGARNGS